MNWVSNYWIICVVAHHTAIHRPATFTQQTRPQRKNSDSDFCVASVLNQPREKPSLWTSHTFSVPYHAFSAVICSSVFTCGRERHWSQYRAVDHSHWTSAAHTWSVFFTAVTLEPSQELSHSGLIWMSGCVHKLNLALWEWNDAL